jgi:hypothetical protein
MINRNKNKFEKMEKLNVTANQDQIHLKTTFLEFYLIVIDYNAKFLKNNIFGIFLSDNLKLPINLWHNFACNFRDPTFSDLIIHSNRKYIPNWLTHIFETIYTTLELIGEKSKIKLIQAT